uniref:Uncharacterized protein n=1 Tax=Anguilla anguilla TaxID=7936 RepID=A0A0E9R723_ANGAN
MAVFNMSGFLSSFIKSNTAH